LRQALVCACLAPLLVVVAGCIERKGPDSAAGREPRRATAPIQRDPWIGMDFREFFPTEPGTKWVYEITVAGKSEPVQYREVSCAGANGKLKVWVQRGLFLKSLYVPGVPGDRGDTADVGGPPRVCALEISVKGRAKAIGTLRCREYVELTVHKDDLGVFFGTDRMLWGFLGGPHLEIDWALAWSPDSVHSADPLWHIFGQQNQGIALSERLVFHSKPGWQITPVTGSADSLLLLPQVEANVLGYEGIQCLHFLRTVASGRGEAGAVRSRADQGFTEDSWFGKGKGLVRLEQNVNGEPTMVWRLKSFSLGLGVQIRSKSVCESLDSSNR